MWHKIKWWLIKPFSKATFFWKESGASIQVMYFHDNTVYVRMVGRTGHEIAIVANQDYVRDIRKWLNDMYDDGGPDVGNKKIVPLNRKLSLRKPPTRPT
jgi:hypothetical protein